jgi:hypothetical protein
MSHEDAEDFCRRLYAALGRPRDSQADDEAFMAIVAQRLETFTRSELLEAADRIMDSYTGKSRWPRLAELKNYCTQARTALQARLAVKNNPKTVAGSAEGVPYVPSAEARRFVKLFAQGRFDQLLAEGELKPISHLPERLQAEIRRKWERHRPMAKDMVAKRFAADLVEGKAR